jgi:toxin FitB
MFLVDTDVLSALPKRRQHPHVVAWVGRQRADDLFISVISIGEIERDIALLRAKDQNFASVLASWLDDVLNVYGARVLPFNLAIARRWGQLSAALGRKDADLQIAATALEYGLTVVTRNISHFEPTGVSVLDPFAPPSHRKS